MPAIDPLANDMRHRIASVLDGTAYTEDDEVIGALTAAALRAVADGQPKTVVTTDPLAYERFRAILTDAVVCAQQSDVSAIDAALADFPDAHFEYRTNDAGVRLRKVVVEGTWEVDPLPAWMDGPTRTDVASVGGCDPRDDVPGYSFGDAAGRPYLHAGVCTWPAGQCIGHPA